ncbi:YHS domain-containing protein [Candidatus Bathyarchaeota archaeon]|nr:MAG: YHS domain-containing protein [Candidatus Bathyarchaeota archaeon]
MTKPNLAVLPNFSSTYDGKKFYFCSTHRKIEFDKAPQKSAGKIAAALSREPVASIEFYSAAPRFL